MHLQPLTSKTVFKVVPVLLAKPVSVIYFITDYLWTGWWDELNEGLYADINDPDSKTLIPNNWQLSEPNGDTRENCAVLGKDLSRFEQKIPD